jgi:high-affinity iron transporter
MHLIGVAASFVLAVAGPGTPGQTDDPAPVARRLAATAQLAAQEYRVGVSDGRVTAPSEVEEARLFLAEARRSAALLPLESARAATEQIDGVLKLIAATAPPDSLDARVRTLAATLSRQLNIAMDEIPAAAPSYARGAAVYAANCASCHGPVGRGDGPAGRSLSPRPANLADAAALRDASPLDFYHRVTIGVIGTAMPAFETRLSAGDRWAVALYASLLRLPAPEGEVPLSLRAFPTSARLSDSAVADALGVPAADARGAARVAAVRSFGTDSSAASSPQVFALVRAQLDSAFAMARAGRGDAASAKAFDAYMTFEQVERGVRAKNDALAGRLETEFASLRTRAAGGATPAELASIRSGLASDLENAERELAAPPSALSLFTNSFVLLVREGLEAILIVGALMTFLMKTGASHRKRDIHVGVGAAVGASVLTAVLLETLFQVTPAKREALEGATMLLATVVLFYVSYWLLSKMEVAKWTQFVKSRVHDAVSSGSALALASAAFLAVYREGFETVLFYKALFVSGGSASVAPVFAGIACGTVVLVAVYVAINRFGVKLPLKPFFAFTGAFLYYMAFVFAGKGVAELQEGGLIPTTVLPWAEAIRTPSLGIYATAESLAAQGILLALFIAALVWSFVIAPRRLKVTRVMVPEPSAVAGSSAAPTVAEAAGAAPLASVELIRSLERMEADLAELRAEVERMRDYVADPRRESSRRKR